MSFSISLAHILLIICLWSELISTICYFPDGSLPQQDSPCLPDQVNAGRASFCCGPGYACLSNRLCKATALSGNINFTRGSCTDKAWNSPDCPNFCLDVQFGGPGVNQCASPFTTRFCCQENLRTCNCSRSDGGTLDFFTDYSIITTIGYSPSTSSISISTTLTSPTSTLASTLATPQSLSTSSTSQSTTVTGSGAISNSSASPQQNSSSNTTPIAVGVSVPCGTILLVLITVLIYRYQRRRRKSQTPIKNSQTVYPAMPMQNHSYKGNAQDHPSHQNQSYSPQEMGRQSPVMLELASGVTSPRELSGH